MLKLQYLGHLMGRVDSLEKTLMLGKIESRRRRGPQRTRWLDGITESMDMSLSKLRRWWRTGRPGHAAVHGVAKSQTRLSHWTTVKYWERASFRYGWIQGLRQCQEFFPFLTSAFILSGYIHRSSQGVAALTLHPTSLAPSGERELCLASVPKMFPGWISLHHPLARPRAGIE